MWSPESWRKFVAKQQPNYQSSKPQAVTDALSKLQKLPPLVYPNEIDSLNQSSKLRKPKLGVHIAFSSLSPPAPPPRLDLWIVESITDQGLQVLRVCSQLVESPRD